MLGILRENDKKWFVMFGSMLIKHVFRNNFDRLHLKDNAQVPIQSMPKISKTHLYYTKVLLTS